MNPTLALQTPPRRLFLGTNALALSAGTIALLACHDALAAGKPVNVKNDLAILNVAVGVELDAWLTNPERTIAGQKMGYQVTDATDRADLIAYLRKVPAP